MPIVPPMVSAATGAALIAHLPSGQPQVTLLIACYAMVGLGLIASLAVITMLWARLEPAASSRNDHVQPTTTNLKEFQ
jgi:tellurite resistance protein TehA-like permease